MRCGGSWPTRFGPVPAPSRSRPGLVPVSTQPDLDSLVPHSSRDEVLTAGPLSEKHPRDVSSLYAPLDSTRVRSGPLSAARLHSEKSSLGEDSPRNDASRSNKAELAGKYGGNVPPVVASPGS